MRVAAGLLVATAFATMACKKPATGPIPAPAEVQVVEGTAVVKNGSIGIKLPEQGTYVLVQAENGSKEARHVVLEGNLVDAAGQVLAPLHMDQLYVPPGERRTFALVASQVVSSATAAKLWVRTAPVAEAPPEVQIRDVKTTTTEAGLAVELQVENTFDKPVLATIIVAFFDERGAIMSRPFTVDNFAGGATRPVFFRGPIGAKTAQAFVGDSAI